MLEASRLAPPWEGFRPTINGLGSGFFGLEVGKVLMLRFKSSFDEPLSTRGSMSRFTPIILYLVEGIITRHWDGE